MNILDKDNPFLEYFMAILAVSLVFLTMFVVYQQEQEAKSLDQTSICTLN